MTTVVIPALAEENVVGFKQYNLWMKMSLHTELGSEWAEVVAGVRIWIYSQNVFSLRVSVQEVWGIS